MIRITTRPASLLDLLWIGRLQARGVSMDPKRALTRAESPLSLALRAPLVWYEPLTLTFIGRAEAPEGSQSGFVQLRSRRSSPQDGDIAFIAPNLAGFPVLDQLWARLLQAVCLEASQANIQRIYASLEAGSAAMTPFLSAGFLLFAREELLVCRTPTPMDCPSGIALRPQAADDAWGLQRLYTATVPLSIKQAEGVFDPRSSTYRPFESSTQSETIGFVLERNGEIVAHVALTPGRAGCWVRFVLRPDAADLTADLVRCGLNRIADLGNQPVYAPVRSYTMGLRSALQEAGFHSLGQRELLVRQTLARVPVLNGIAVRRLDHRPEVPAAPTLVHRYPIRPSPRLETREKSR